MERRVKPDPSQLLDKIIGAAPPPHPGKRCDSKHVKTTMIYTHVLNRGGLAVRSPLD